MQKLNLTEATCRALEVKLLKESINDKEAVAKKVFEEVGMFDSENDEFRILEMGDHIVVVDLCNGADDPYIDVFDSYYDALKESGIFDDIKSGMSHEDYVKVNSQHGLFTNWGAVSIDTWNSLKRILNSNK